jgi:hypothetical protein
MRGCRAAGGDGAAEQTDAAGRPSNRRSRRMGEQQAGAGLASSRPGRAVCCSGERWGVPASGVVDRRAAVECGQRRPWLENGRRTETGARAVSLKT